MQEALTPSSPLQWRRHHSSFRRVAANRLTGVLTRLRPLMQQEGKGTWRELSKWYAKQRGWKIQKLVGLRLLARVAGICQGVATAVIKHIRGGLAKSIEAVLLDWRAQRLDVLKYSIAEVFRHAVACSEDAEAQHLLDDVLPKATRSELVTEEHLDYLRAKGLELELFTVTCCSWRRPKPHTFLFYFSAEADRYEWIDTTPGYGLYRFESVAEAIEAFASLLQTARPQFLGDASWRVKTY